MFSKASKTRAQQTSEYWGGGKGHWVEKRESAMKGNSHADQECASRNRFSNVYFPEKVTSITNTEDHRRRFRGQGKAAQEFRKRLEISMKGYLLPSENQLRQLTKKASREKDTQRRGRKETLSNLRAAASAPSESSFFWDAVVKEEEKKGKISGPTGSMDRALFVRAGRQMLFHKDVAIGSERVGRGRADPGKRPVTERGKRKTPANL